jgi:uncharacterized membrane protein YdcZ (DUF606 family)
MIDTSKRDSHPANINLKRSFRGTIVVIFARVRTLWELICGLRGAVVMLTSMVASSKLGSYSTRAAKHFITNNTH